MNYFDGITKETVLSALSDEQDKIAKEIVIVKMKMNFFRNKSAAESHKERNLETLASITSNLKELVQYYEYLREKSEKIDDFIAL